MIIEIRTYRLKPGTAKEFLRIMREEAFPLLEKFGLHVLAGGITLAEGDDAYLIRAFTSLEERDKQEAEFYGSDEWRNGPREGVISRIESYHDVVLEGDRLGADILRFAGAQGVSGGPLTPQSLPQLQPLVEPQPSQT